MEKREIKKSQIIGGMLLIAGNCIGAGMLALPVLTGVGGFTPSIGMFLLCWLFMTTTGLLLLEVNLSLDGSANIISMVEKTLGKVGKFFCWITWAFLFYCLLVAYVAGSGALLTSVLANLFDLNIPNFVGSTLFVLFFGFLVYLGTHAVDHFNRWLMFGLIASYVFLVIMGAQDVNVDLLQRTNWSYVPFMLPVLVISFGFHNIIPTLVPYFKRDRKVLKWVLYMGSLIPLFIYLIWQWVVLGVVSENELQEALKNGDTATGALKLAVGHSLIGTLAEYFAFFALITSFLAVALSFVHFLEDGLKIKKSAKNNVYLCLLVLLPPFIFALSFPHIFLSALNYAGGIGAVILFGVMPALMAWRLRYNGGRAQKVLVPGGRFVLVLVILFALFVLTLQVGSAIGIWGIS